jgi:hypothetical protein
MGRAGFLEIITYVGYPRSQAIKRSGRFVQESNTMVSVRCTYAAHKVGIIIIFCLRARISTSNNGIQLKYLK